jgi:hypothetical protein
MLAPRAIGKPLYHPGLRVIRALAGADGRRFSDVRQPSIIHCCSPHLVTLGYVPQFRTHKSAFGLARLLEANSSEFDQILIGLHEILSAAGSECERFEDAMLWRRDV